MGKEKDTKIKLWRKKLSKKDKKFLTRMSLNERNFLINIVHLLFVIGLSLTSIIVSIVSLIISLFGEQTYSWVILLICGAFLFFLWFIIVSSINEKMKKAEEHTENSSKFIESLKEQMVERTNKDKEKGT